MIDELRRIHREGRVRMTSNCLIDAGYAGLVAACVTYAGSFRRARRLARIPDPGRALPREIERWDEDRVISEIRAAHRGGKPLNYEQASSKLRSAGKKYYGSWRGAIEAAGLDYAQIRLSREPRTRDEILTALRDGARSKRVGIGPDGFLSWPIWQAARRMFGSLHKAIHAAGLDPELVLQRTARSDHEIRSILQRLASERPTMTLGELYRHKIGSMIANRFESVDAALRRFGFDGWPRRLIGPPLSAEDVLAGLRRRRRRGHSLRSADAGRDDRRLKYWARKHFGTWGKALQAAGLGALARSYRTRQQVLDDLVARHARGEPLDARTMLRDDPTLLRAAEHRFRSLPRALLAARLPLPKGARLRQKPGVPWIRWSADRVVSEIRSLYESGELTSQGAPKRLKQAARTYHGSWQAAVEAAGLDYARIRRRRRGSWTRDKVLETLRDGARSKRIGVGPDGFVTKAVSLAAFRAFGSLRAAILAAGLDPEIVLRRSNRSDRDLQSMLQRLAAERPGMIVSELRMHKLGSMLERRFGNLRAGLERFGFTRWPKRVYLPALPAKEVIARVRDRHRRRRSMLVRVVLSEDPRLHWAALKHFGTWTAALEAALVRRSTRT